MDQKYPMSNITVISVVSSCILLFIICLLSVYTAKEDNTSIAVGLSVMVFLTTVVVLVTFILIRTFYIQKSMKPNLVNTIFGNNNNDSSNATRSQKFVNTATNILNSVSSKQS